MDLFQAVKLIVFDPLYTLLIGGPLVILLVQPTVILLRSLIGQVRHLEREELIEYAKDTLLDIFAILLVGTHEFNITRWSRIGVAFLAAIIGLKCLHHLIQIRLSHLHEAGLTDENALSRLSRLIISFQVVALTLLKVATSLTTGAHSDRFILAELVGQGILSVLAIVRLATLYVHFSLEAHSPDGNGWPLKSDFWFVFDLLSDITALAVWLFIYIDGPTPMLSAVGYLQMQTLARQVYRRVTAFMRYRSLTARLGADFPDASLDELENADVCIICRDLLTIGCKRLTCGHVLHFDCLKNWFMHHQSCPTCRADIVLPNDSRGAQTADRPQSNTEGRAGGRWKPGEEARYEGEVELSAPTILRGMHSQALSELVAAVEEKDSPQSQQQQQQQVRQSGSGSGVSLRWWSRLVGRRRVEEENGGGKKEECSLTAEQLSAVLKGMSEQQAMLARMMDELDMRGGC